MRYVASMRAPGSCDGMAASAFSSESGRIPVVGFQLPTLRNVDGGKGASVNVNHSGTVTIQTMDEATTALEARLASLAMNMEKRAELEASLVDGLGDIIDAEVVDEPHTQAR